MVHFLLTALTAVSRNSSTCRWSAATASSSS